MMTNHANDKCLKLVDWKQQELTNKKILENQERILENQKEILNRLNVVEKHDIEHKATAKTLKYGIGVLLAGLGGIITFISSEIIKWIQ